MNAYITTQTSSSAGLLQAQRCSSLQQLRAELAALTPHWPLHGGVSAQLLDAGTMGGSLRQGGAASPAAALGQALSCSKYLLDP
ncbi:MAG: hypothetical protein FRX49_03269 [Trebouxia sp. A1-2]|nr:MAG: hypothetical protein FRX49_03269 [Trebouxia sp. A1-2]